MKKLLLILFCLGILSHAHATEYFGGSGAGAVKLSPPERDYATPWINVLVTQVSASANLAASDRADALDVLTQLTLLANPVGTFGTFVRTAGGSTGTMTVTADPDSLVDAEHVPGSAYLVDLTLEVPSAPPPPALFTLTATADAGGTVSGGGTFASGTWAFVSAAPDALHDFTGWSGDASGMAIPVGVLVDRDRAVHAGFALRLYPLVTTATAGGTVTPGGAYPYGTSVTISAAADAGHFFSGWSGDATGSAPDLTLVITAPTAVQANFTPKLAQVITFNPPGDREVGPPFAPDASASSGLPVVYSVVSGPATIVGGNVQVTGPGVITVQASQPGNTFYLPAAAVTQTFNGIAATIVRLSSSAHLQIATRALRLASGFLIQSP